MILMREWANKFAASSQDKATIRSDPIRSSGFN